MTTKLKTILMGGIPLVLGLAGTAAVLLRAVREPIPGPVRTRSEEDALEIAHLVARSVAFATEAARRIEDNMSEWMVAQAAIAAHLVAVAEAAGLGPDEINARLKAIADDTVINEIWVTDENGHAYLRNSDVDFTFSPDPKVQPQASAFWPLLTGKERVVAQPARRREIDNQVFKYVGVAGIDKRRIVRVGIGPASLERLQGPTGLKRLIDGLVRESEILAVRVVDPNLATLAYGAQPGRLGYQEVRGEDAAMLREVIRDRQARTFIDGSVLKAMAPVVSPDDDRLIGATIVYLSRER